MNALTGVLVVHLQVMVFLIDQAHHKGVPTNSSVPLKVDPAGRVITESMPVWVSFSGSNGTDVEFSFHLHVVQAAQATGGDGDATSANATASDIGDATDSADEVPPDEDRESQGGEGVAKPNVEAAAESTDDAGRATPDDAGTRAPPKREWTAADNERMLRDLKSGKGADPAHIIGQLLGRNPDDDHHGLGGAGRRLLSMEGVTPGRNVRRKTFRTQPPAPRRTTAFRTARVLSRVVDGRKPVRVLSGTSQTASMLEVVSEHVGMRGARSSGSAASPPVTVAGIDALVKSASRRRMRAVQRYDAACVSVL